MYLHIGNDVVIRDNNIIGIFDLDRTTVSKNTRQFLDKAQKDLKVVNVSEDLPKSFVLALSPEGVQVYLSQISPATLSKRAEEIQL